MGEGENFLKRVMAGDAYAKTVERLEPDITPVDHDGAMASIAISLKRIADALEEANTLTNMYRVQPAGTDDDHTGGGLFG